MKFEEAINGLRKVTFEVDDETKFHEQAIAMSALGILTAKHRKDAEKRLPPARLAAIIAVEEMKPEKDDGKSVVSPTSGELDHAGARLLSDALDEFIRDTPDAIRAIIAVGNPHVCSVRAVEADMAQTMLDQVRDAFDIPPPPAELNSEPTGFR